jgi:hypothetical protein
MMEDVRRKKEENIDGRRKKEEEFDVRSQM